MTASLMGRGASPLNSVYASTKHALRSYFASLAAKERSWLRVDLVLPGATATNLWSSSSTSGISGKNDSQNQSLFADDRSKMSVRRYAQLIISSLIGPNFLFYETWITRQPGLLWVYLASHAPSTVEKEWRRRAISLLARYGPSVPIFALFQMPISQLLDRF